MSKGGVAFVIKRCARHNIIATTQPFSEIKWCLKPKQTTVALRFKKHFHCKTV